MAENSQTPDPARPPFKEPPQAPEKPVDNDDLESQIDEALDESFPASDPPNWASIARSKRALQKEREKAEEEIKKGACAGA